ncbi:MAG TPA: hypothetical protein VJG30_00830 [Candidatus Nanoarchaeia archaeon]|nr:hypothetical protein [Candidatus Nanoarchaeia archaeon]
MKAEIKNIEREIKITLNFIEEAIISLIKTAAIIKRKLGDRSYLVTSTNEDFVIIITICDSLLGELDSLERKVPIQNKPFVEGMKENVKGLKKLSSNWKKTDDEKDRNTIAGSILNSILTYLEMIINSYSGLGRSKTSLEKELKKLK